MPSEERGNSVLCVTGHERTAGAWRARLGDSDRRCAQARVAPPLHELRLDALDTVDDSTFELMRAHPSRVIACCRPKRQGGDFAGDENERIDLLLRAARAGAKWTDVEADVPPEQIDALRAVAGVHGGDLLVSWHDFETIPADLGERVRTIAALRPAAIKIAVMVDDASQISELLSIIDPLPMLRVLVAMGPAGLLSRTHYAALGSAWTYLAADAGACTAPGQIDLPTALAWAMPSASTGPLCALCGGDQVMRSPGVTVYNRLFRARGDRLSYVPIITHTLARTLPLIERIGARGLSVTMPLKLQALSLCAPDAVAQQIGAVNSLRWRDGWQGTNTDVTGMVAPLAPLVASRGLRRAVILGAGGAARAALLAASRLGLRIEICARRLDAARELAAGGSAKYFLWGERSRCLPLRDAVLINTTPISGSESPWPEATSLDAAVVFDTAMGEQGSRLLDRARGSGAVIIDPMQMWLAQGAAQMSWMLDEPISAADLELLTA